MDCNGLCGAAVHAHVAVVQWLWLQACLWSGKAVTATAAGGHLDLLQWVSNHQLPCLLHLAINLFSVQCDKMAGSALHMTQANALWRPTTITCMC